MDGSFAVKLAMFNEARMRKRALAAQPALRRDRAGNPVPRRRVEIKAEDLRIDQFSTGGSVAGTTCTPNEASMRITHLPTGLVETGTAQDGESVLALKARLLGVLGKRLVQDAAF